VRLSYIVINIFLQGLNANIIKGPLIFLPTGGSIDAGGVVDLEQGHSNFPGN